MEIFNIDVTSEPVFNFQKSWELIISSHLKINIPVDSFGSIMGTFKQKTLEQLQTCLAVAESPEFRQGPLATWISKGWLQDTYRMTWWRLVQVLPWQLYVHREKKNFKDGYQNALP